MLRRFLAVSVVIIAVSAGCTRQQNEPRGSVAAPDFTLQDLSGKNRNLSDYKGRVVLLDFWATWCPPCRAAIPGIERLHKTYSDKGLTVLAISMDDGGWDTVKSFMNEYGITYPVLKATEDVVDKYMVRSIPTLILVDKQGNLHKQFMGFATEDVLEREIKAIL